MMVGKLDYRNLMASVSKDSSMLRDLGIMDYSLLLSVRRVIPNNKRASVLMREITCINPAEDDESNAINRMGSDTCGSDSFQDKSSFVNMLAQRTSERG